MTGDGPLALNTGPMARMSGQPPPTGKGRPRQWSVYLIRCRDGTLYTGIAIDVCRRLAEHRLGGGRGSRYLSGRGPLRLVFQRPVGGLSLALRLEHRIKRLPRARKERLVRGGSLPELLRG